MPLSPAALTGSPSRSLCRTPPAAAPAVAADCQAALDYLKKRPDADPRGVGLYGFSKGANAGLVVAARDPFVRCAVTDGAFGHYSVMVPYMRVWFSIYNPHRPLHGLIGAWFFGLVARSAMLALERGRGVRFPDGRTAVP